ncbi:hypothetical protein TOPH_02093 [Tolypocladium ophioglossoides CBS 100239]|uniref:Zn(2)-C6 fungal-type domain-containing protein n=1 Tax=Tolypocladium ophioglossoides (strain CBS 100239) TaxID=1163406 RepID=A0A0L0NG57_TOLOC|nr:hypothetical protein TOPH_02093 [Tolypocladium ophioglossoides CBS 100239]
MAESVPLNSLSCAKCKERKVRCNRVVPQCDRCSAQHVECVYPERAKRRRSTRPAADRPTPVRSASGDDPLNTILERLQRLEQRRAASPPRSSRDGQPDPSFATSPALSTPLTSHVPSEPSPAATLAPAPDLDATAILKDAMDQVQRQKLRSYARSVITDKIDIPPELAKAWIHSELRPHYFTHTPTDMFLSLVNKRLIELIPDIAGLPHVHLDYSILVLYYAILNALAERGIDYAKLCYLGCLRALPGWQQEATGSTTDFIAALFMTRVAAMCFDYDLAWKMHQNTSDFARSLNLHNLDGGDYAGINDSARSDQDRKGFWQLIQIDLYIRLLLDKPATVTADVWKVNLPWLDANSHPPPDGVPAIAFLINSRMTMILIRFFALLEETRPRPRDELRRRTEDLCREIQQLFDDWITSASSREEDTWVIADALLTGHICLIFMLRKVDTVNTDLPQEICKDLDVPTSPLVLDASRYFVKLINHVLTIYPYAETMSAMLGTYGAYAPAACLYYQVLHAPDVRLHMADIQSLERLTDRVSVIASSQREFYPFIRAMEKLNSEVRKRVNDTGA